MPDPSYIHIQSVVIDYCLYMRVEFGQRNGTWCTKLWTEVVPLSTWCPYFGHVVIGEYFQKWLKLEVATQSLAPGFLVLDTVLYVFGKCLTSELCV